MFTLIEMISIAAICTSLGVGICIVIHRPTYAEDITVFEFVFVVLLWWAVLAIMKVRDKLGW